jgi:SAM-dependent methyltransferase
MHISTRNKIKFFGVKRHCPICKSWVRYFKPAGKNQRPDALCPICGSYERHRLVWLFFKKRTALFTASLEMLHAAPENCFVRRLKARENLDYISIDLDSPLADRKMDLTNLEFPGQTFDFFYCGHVLEHIPDDGKAISEIYRVLKPSGTAVIMVPTRGEHTVEDREITDPAEREKLYGQADHVRIYGRDFPNRLEKKGFQVRTVDFYSAFSQLKRRFYGLSQEDIYYCRK